MDVCPNYLPVAYYLWPIIILKKARFRIGLGYYIQWHNPEFYISNPEILKDAYTQRSKFPKYNSGTEFKVTEKIIYILRRIYFTEFSKQHSRLSILNK